MTKQELAKRAVASKGWRWMPGMQCIWPNGNEWRAGQVTAATDDAGCPIGGNYPCNGWGDEYPDRTTGLPDIDDPATLGCLMALVREAWGDGEALGIAAHAMPQIDRDGLVVKWHVWIDKNFMDSRVVGCGATEAEALVAALDAAP